MKVYVITIYVVTNGYEYDDYEAGWDEVLGVFASRPAAVAYIEALIRKRKERIHAVKQDTQDTHSWSFSLRSSEFYNVTPFDVQGEPSCEQTLM